MLAAFTAGNYPDVAYLYGSWARQPRHQPEAGRPHRPRRRSPSSNWNDFYPAEREAATVNGKVVGVPALIDNLALVYNKKLFAAGRASPPPTADWTWAGLPRRGQASSPTRPTRRYGWAYVNDGSEDTVWRFLALLWQAGGDLLTADNKQAGLRLRRRLRPRCSSCRHGRHRQVGLPRHTATATTSTCSTAARSRCSGPARGTCRASTPT